ncbi:hypothetical protein [Pontibacter chinhatensis]|uniref:Uncharacterized protein n=1 Tax=Pontibacter chinhatensis TaxID=1436961 RepID=A0A1I2XTB6_9BACT|nr:hypothetical protein [Pontibacter chinhatensis]SFH16642.1 hypothetical protein SAMN05421739_106225 [Pontibacter chinhatensis]
MLHLPLFPRQVAGKALSGKVLKLVPLYKLKQVNAQPASFAEASPEFSSPVCYAHLKGFREGFEE